MALDFGDPKHTLYLIDVSSFIFRAFFAIRELNTQAGEPVNAVYGVASMLARLNDDARPEYLGIAFDSKGPSKRKEIYADYKANRAAAPEKLIPQFDRIEHLIQCMGMHSYRQDGVEADDLIATLTRQWCAAVATNRVVIVTGDKDLMALVDDRVRIWDTLKGVIYEAKDVEEKFGVRPDQIRDYLSLVGDSSDNIPGVPSIGPKSAVELLKAHQTLEAVLQAAIDGKIPGKKGETLNAHRADALLSQQLATLALDLPVKIDAAALKYRFHVTEACAQLLRDLDFHSLLKKWTLETGGAPAAAQSESPRAEGAVGINPSNFKMINTEQDFQALLAELERSPEFGFDVETTSLNPRAAELVGVSLCTRPDSAVYIPVGHRGTHTEQLPVERVLDGLRPFLENPRYKKVGQNLKYDWSVMRELGVRCDGIGADTMVAAYVLQPDGRHNLETLAQMHLGYAVTTYEAICGKGKDQLGFDQVPVDVATRYSAEDSWVAMRLWDRLRPKLQHEGMMEVFATVELPLVPVLSRIEARGVRIDEKWLKDLSREFELELRSIEERVGAFTSGPINLNSTKQLANLLFDQLGLPTQSKTKTGFSTDASVLQILAPLHEVPKLLLEYREITKLKGTYIDPLPLLKDAKTGRLHTSYQQTVAATGRLSSSDPNLQNIPIRTERGRKIRRAFLASEGNVLISADYSQIELRLLAHMSGDRELVGSFKRGEDVHRRTASEIFGVKPEEVDDRQRGIAKAVNFGLMYGKTPFGLSQELRIPRKEAQEVIDRYFERYSGVKQFLDRQVLECKERGWTSTLLGRKRFLPDIRSSNPAIRQNAERMAMNAPIQGTAADLIKLAMIALDDEIEKRKLKAQLILQVHDEVVLDCPEQEADEVQALVTRVMEGAMSLSVPLCVNSARASNWADL